MVAFVVRVCDLVVREEVGVLVYCTAGDVLLVAHWNELEDGTELGHGIGLEWRICSLPARYTVSSRGESWNGSCVSVPFQALRICRGLRVSASPVKHSQVQYNILLTQARNLG